VASPQLQLSCRLVHGVRRDRLAQSAGWQHAFAAGHGPIGANLPGGRAWSALAVRDQGPGTGPPVGRSRRLPPGQYSPWRAELESGRAGQGHGVDGDEPFPVSHGFPHRRLTPWHSTHLSRKELEAHGPPPSRPLAVGCWRPNESTGQRIGKRFGGDWTGRNVRSTAALIALCWPPPLALRRWISGGDPSTEPCSSGCRQLHAKRALGSSNVQAAGLSPASSLDLGRGAPLAVPAGEKLCSRRR